MKIFILLLSINIGFFLNGQVQKGDYKLTDGSTKHALYFQISEKYNIGVPDDIEKELLQVLPELNIVLSNYDFTIKKGYNFSEESLSRMEQNMLKTSKNASSVIKLRNTFRLIINNPSNQRLLDLAYKLEQIEGINYVNLVSLEPVSPPNDIPPPTPDYEPDQTYLDSDPGVNMKFAWEMDITGEGIRVRDVEYGFNPNHEDLVDQNITLADGMTINSQASELYTEHGTSVFGILGANKGEYGVSGMVYNAAEFILFPEWQESGYDRVEAVTKAIENSDIGDVIIYEMQTGGQGNNYVPAEYDATIWDLTKAATDTGIIIVAAAGNGNQNLDNPFYNSYNDRGDSGAIIVGAGTPDIDHNRINTWWGSTYGSRVNLQAWGENVRTSGYGDFSEIGGDFNQRYVDFNGTSSATPIVAACVIALQSYYYELTGEYLTGSQLKTILIDTGIPQGDPENGNIGPFPDMEAAIQKLQDEYLTTFDINNKQTFKIYPNPVGSELNILLGKPAENTRVELYNLVGQKLISKQLKSNLKLSMKDHSVGVYIVNIVQDGNIIFSQKIIRK